MLPGESRTRSVRAWAGVALALALATTGVLPTAGAATDTASAVAADAPGTVDVNRIPSRQPEIDVLGASSAGVLYRVMRSYSGGEWQTYLKPTGKPPYQVANDFQYLAGDKIYGPTSGYLMIGSTVPKTCPEALAPAYSFRSAQGSAYTPFGWISRSNQLVTADADGCRVTGTIPAIGDYKLAAADATGYVTVESEDAGRATLGYHSYADPATTRPIQTGGRNLYVHGFDLAGSVVTWVELDYSDLSKQRAFVVRSSTTGGPAKVTLVGRMVDSTAINGTATGWAACDYSAITRCTAGSISAEGVTTEVLDSRAVASDGTRFYVGTYGASPGVDSATVIDGKSWTRLVSFDLLLPRTHSVDAAAGSVAYIDDQSQAGQDESYVLARRPVSKSGNTLTLGAQQVFAGYTGDFPITRDGDRTAYEDAGGDLWLTTDGGTKTRVFDSSVDIAVAWTAWPAPFNLSGHRLLWVKGEYTGEHCDPPFACQPVYGKARLMMFDLRTGKNVDLGATTLTRPAALWGNYLVTTDSTNRILRKDLSTGAVVQVKAAGARVTGLDVNGTIVGWSTCATAGADPCGVSRIGYKIVSSSAPAVELATAHLNRVSLSGGHLAYAISSNDGTQVKAWRLGTTTTTVIGTAFGRNADVPFEIHDETLAWIGADRIARATPLAPFGARPRYLGNASGAASFVPSAGQRWSPSFPISKALPTCAITIKSGPTVKRSLPCATSTGMARASWDGRDAGGKLVAKGGYTWTISGSDADGALLWWNGSANPITGTITVA